MAKVRWVGLCGAVLALLSCGSDSGSIGDGGRDVPQVLSENTAGMCQDGVDNDGDGFVDCKDQDCWPLVLCADSRPDGWKPPHHDANVTDGIGDSPGDGQPVTDAALADGGVTFDTGHQSCVTHWDCDQEWFCYKGKCIKDPKVPVYHCGKQDAQGNDTCPPGHWCVTPQGTKDLCPESATYVCADACDCGPAHCCKKDTQGIGRCVKDEADPWKPGPGTGAGPAGLACQTGDATFCCGDPSCHAAKAAYGSQIPRFRCYDRDLALTKAFCGHRSCFGTACNCDPGESCVDTLEHAPPGKSCQLLSGGSCVSNASAEALFDWKSTDLLPCCAAGCVVGVACDLGWRRSGGKYAYQRVVGSCGPCADGTHWSCGQCGNGGCDEGEYPTTCPTDCGCGDGACAPAEHGSCAADCGSCGDGACTAGESPATCPQDCQQSTTCGDGWCTVGESCAVDCDGRCSDSPALSDHYRVCGDGVCVHSGCQEPETCRSCPQDCGPCSRWEKIHGAVTWSTDSLRAVWGTTATNIIAVGDNGTALRFDGIVWHPMFTGTTARLHAVWGSKTDVFAVGTGGTILRYDGTVWGPVASGTTESLADVWGTSGDDVFAVGDAGTILHLDGSGAWQPVSAGATGASLRGVWGNSSSDVLVVGSTYEATSGSTAPTILRYDGQTWTPEDLGSPMDFGVFTQLHDLWGSSASDIFVVGRQCLAWPCTTTAVVLHYDGGKWESMLSGQPLSFSAIWGTSQSDVFASGSFESTTSSISLGPAIWHYDGQKWEEQLSATGGPWHLCFLGLWGSSATDVLAVGSDGTVLRYGGSGWSEEFVSGSGSSADVTDVWGSSKDDVHAALGTPFALHFDGVLWTTDSVAPPPWDDGYSCDGFSTTVAISGSGAADVVAAGLYNEGCAEGGGDYNSGTIERFDGVSWKHEADVARPLKALWAGVFNDAYAVGGGCNSHTMYSDCGGTVVHFDGSQWAAVATPTETLWDIWGSPQGTLFAVGDGGVTLRGQGNNWATINSGTTERIRAVWGTADTNVYAISEAGLLHWDGKKWAAASAPPGLIDISGTSQSEVFAIDQDGVIWRFDGGTWHGAYDPRVVAPRGYVCPRLNAIGETLTGDLLVGGNDELVLHHPASDAGAAPDAGVPIDSGPGPSCPDGTCDLGESCDGRDATVACPQDCPGGFLNNPNKEFCFVNGVCVGPGCQ